MKILRWLFALVMLMTATEALAAGHSVEVYYGTNGDMRSSMIFSLKIMMHQRSTMVDIRVKAFYEQVIICKIRAGMVHPLHLQLS